MTERLRDRLTRLTKAEILAAAKRTADGDRAERAGELARDDDDRAEVYEIAMDRISILLDGIESLGGSTVEAAAGAESPIMLTIVTVAAISRARTQAGRTYVARRPAAGIPDAVGLPTAFTVTPELLGPSGNILKGREITFRFRKTEHGTVVVAAEGADAPTYRRIEMHVELASGKRVSLAGEIIAKGGHWEFDPEGKQMLTMELDIVEV